MTIVINVKYKIGKRRIQVFHLRSCLIKSKANCVHVLTVVPVSAAVLLHEGH